MPILLVFLIVFCQPGLCQTERAENGRISETGPFYTQDNLGDGTSGALWDKEVSPHAFYLAVIQLDHAAGGATAQVTIKVFTDDLQDALRNAFPDEFRPVATAAFCERLGEQAGRYFARHFSCVINGEERSMTLQRCELQNDVYLLQFELACPADWRELTVKADFFMELFPSQTNVLSILHGKEKGFFRLTKGAEACTVAF